MKRARRPGGRRGWLGLLSLILVTAGYALGSLDNPDPAWGDQPSEPRPAAEPSGPGELVVPPLSEAGEISPPPEIASSPEPEPSDEAMRLADPLGLSRISDTPPPMPGADEGNLAAQAVPGMIDPEATSAMPPAAPDGPASSEAPRVEPVEEPAAPAVVLQEPGVSSEAEVPPVPPRPLPDDQPAREDLLAPPPVQPVPLDEREHPAGPPSAPLALPEALTDADDSRVSLRVENQEIRRALELLGSQVGVNILASPGVSGTISLNLEDVPFRQALDVLLRLGDLAAWPEDNILFVYTAEEAAQIEARARKPEVRIYHLNYVRAEDLFAMIQPFLSAEGTLSRTPPSQQGISLAHGASGLRAGAPGAPMGGDGLASGPFIAAGAPVSGAGAVSGGNSFAVQDMIIVRDYPENLQTIDEIVARLDVQPLQVLIEAVIVSVELRDDQELGVNFALVDHLASHSVAPGSGGQIHTGAGFSPAGVLSVAGPPGLGPDLGHGAGHLLPGHGGDHGLRYGFVCNHAGGFIRALERLNKINILASPRVLVLNKQQAEIQLGERLGFRNTVTNLTSSLQTVEFLSVGTLLTLRPFVSQDGMIRMEIHPEKSTGVLDARGIPQTRTSELTTNILVPDGATIVIGGLIDSTDELTPKGHPKLNRLPVVGPLFRSRTMETRKTELLVLLTPRILNRNGLPQPVPGVAPMGPSGIPNSGPMPGPLFLAAGSGEPSPAPLTCDPAALSRRWTGHNVAAPEQKIRELFASGFDATSFQEPAGGWISPPASATAALTPGHGHPARDVQLQPARHVAPLDGTSAAAPETRPAPPVGGAAARGDQDQSYRPGDLTRATIARLRRPFTRHDPPDDPAEMTPPPGAAPAPVDAAVGQATIQTHVVGQGEDFRSIARDYFGTTSLAAALWAVNGHHIASSEDLQPGMTILVPPAEVLEQVNLQALETTTRLQSPPVPPEPSPPPRRRWLSRMFGSD